MKIRFEHTIPAALGFLTLLALSPGCGSGEARSDADPVESPGPQAAPAVPVEVAALEPAP